MAHSLNFRLVVFLNASEFFTENILPKFLDIESRRILKITLSDSLSVSCPVISVKNNSTIYF